MTLWLAACHAASVDNAAVTARADAAAADPNAIECAPAGAKAFTRACTVNRETAPRGLLLTLHDPDGGFHRLIVTRDGHGVAAADGAQPISVSITGTDMIEVGIAGNRYRLPATIGKRGR